MMTGTTTTRRLTMLVRAVLSVMLVVLLGSAAAGCALILPAQSGKVTEAAAPQTAEPQPSSTAPTPVPENPVPENPSKLPGIPESGLPPEAWDTLDLIETGGPFPFERDGMTFRNSERLLPAEPRGYYREYTVITPGENDRGARRIVVGGNHEKYYTADHYSSFAFIEEGQ